MRDKVKIRAKDITIKAFPGCYIGIKRSCSRWDVVYCTFDDKDIYDKQRFRSRKKAIEYVNKLLKDEPTEFMKSVINAFNSRKGG